jgi:hypothetical protein
MYIRDGYLVDVKLRLQSTRPCPIKIQQIGRKVFF